MTHTIRRVLVPIDFSTTSDTALGYAATLADALGASLHLLHVFEEPYSAGILVPEVYVSLPTDVRDAALRAAQQELAKRVPTDRPRWTVTTEVGSGIPAKCITECAEREAIDLIVMGTHGRSGVAHLLLGSVAEKVVRNASCPVLTVRERATRKLTRHEAAALATDTATSDGPAAAPPTRAFHAAV